MRRGVPAVSVFHRLSSFDFATTAFCLVCAASAASAKQHLITGAKHFVITDSDEPQLYRLLGIFPYLNTLPNQALLAALVTLVVGLPVALYFYLRPRHPYATWTSRLPDWAINLLFLIRIESDAYWLILQGEVMSLMSASTSVGLNTLSSVSTWSPFASCSKKQQQQQGVPSRRTGRASLRRNARNLGLSASKSTAAADASNAPEPAFYPGLYNTGNSCFLNSTLQSLASLEGFQRYLEDVMVLAETWDVPTPATDAMHQLITDLNTPLVKRGALLPRQLTDALSSLPRTNVGSFFHAHQQQDAHELLVLLTSAIDDELGVINTERGYVLRRQAVGLRAAIAPSIPSLYSSSSFASTSVNPFRSLIAQRTACLDCGYVEAVRHYPTDELSLGVPFRVGGSATTLEMCLRTWSKLERVEWICFQCSLRKTLDRARNDVQRLSSVNTSGSETTKALSNGTQNGCATTSGNIISNGKLSNSKKKKLREARKKEAVLAMILTERLSEDEVESARLLENADIKLERAYSTLSTKQVMMARTPKVLAIHLNRSSYSASNFGASKNNTPVIFDEFLDVGDVVTNGELNISGSHPISRGSTPALADMGSGAHNGANSNSCLHPSSQQTLYHLCAIVVHYGSHSSGHYVSFRRRRIKVKAGKSDDIDQTESKISSDLWYRISDDSVSPCTLRTVLSQNPFILFYERVDDSNGRRGSRQDTVGSSNNINSTALGYAEGRLPRLPSGFESLGKDDLQKKLSAHRPRIVERWNTPVL